MDVAQGQKFWWADQPPHFTITVEEASGLTVIAILDTGALRSALLQRARSVLASRAVCKSSLTRRLISAARARRVFLLREARTWYFDTMARCNLTRFSIERQNKEPLHVTVLQQNPSGQTVTVATLTV
eukprot:853946-Rhodomonas_salina.2